MRRIVIASVCMGLAALAAVAAERRQPPVPQRSTADAAAVELKSLQGKKAPVRTTDLQSEVGRLLARERPAKPPR